MDKRIIVERALSCMIAIASVQAAQAQNAPVDQQPSPYLPDSISHPIHKPAQGTGKLQQQVLIQINDGLINGWLSAAAASQFKSELNKLNDTESQYVSLNSQIPQDLIDRNTLILNEMRRDIYPRTVKSATTTNSMHSDIDELISKALASNHITSGQAESYYLRLAQAESNLESTKEGSAGFSAEREATDKTLQQLKAELLLKNK